MIDQTKFNIIKDLYDNKQITAEKGLKNAVVKKWIDPEDYKTICGKDYTAPTNTQGATA